jgi:hypothetical protein
MLNLVSLGLAIAETIDGISKGKSTDALNDKAKQGVLLANGNIIDLIKPYIVEPTIVVSNNLQHHEELKNVISYKLNLFASIFIKAFKALSLKGYDADTSIRLLATNSETTLYDKIERAFEAFDKIDAIANEEVSFLPITDDDFTMESEKDNKFPVFTKEIEVKFELFIKGDVYKINIPMLVRSPIFYITSNGLANLYKKLDVDQNSELMRFHKWRAGELNTVSYVLGLDLLADLKSLDRGPDSELVRGIQKRIQQANKKVITEGVAGLSKYFMMLIIDKQTRIKIEANTGERLFSKRGKDRFLESLKSMMVTELDDVREMATIATISLDSNINVRYKMLATSAKKASVEDLFKLIKG